MGVVFQISDYYKLLALHRALMQAKFARNPIDPVISGSPFIAEMAEQIVNTLVAMEVERGYPERAEAWKIRIDPNGELWQIALSRISSADETTFAAWGKWSFEEKKHYAKILISPFIADDGLLQKFVQEADQNIMQSK